MVQAAAPLARYADMFAALGAEARLGILRLLLAAHPGGLVVGEIQAETGIAGSTLSHHLDKLKQEGLVTVARQKTFLRYRASTDALEDLLGFLYAECCTRTSAVSAGVFRAPTGAGGETGRRKVSRKRRGA